MPRWRVSLIAGFVALAACAASAGAQGAHGPSHTTSAAPGWDEVGSTSTIAVYVDTARMEHLPHAGGDVWFRFVYTTPQKFGHDTTDLFHAAELHEQVDCPRQRARDLGGRLQKAGGGFVSLPAQGSRWESFRQHPLGPFVFVTACQLLGHPVSARGT